MESNARERLRARIAQVAESRSHLDEGELLWRDRQPFLESKGYMLRSRYRPGWTPSWLGNDVVFEECDDWYFQLAVSLIDAVRISDGKLVYIKAIHTDSEELKILRLLQSLPSDPMNHCVPLLDYFADAGNPELSFIVMPYLQFMEEPPFETVANVVDFVDQMLDGLTFLHAHGVAHRDCSQANIMIDPEPIYPSGFHPVSRTRLPDLSGFATNLSRTEVTLKYYYIDFGISVYIPPESTQRLVVGEDGRDQDPPELSEDVPYDPFKLDVFIIGNMFHNEFVQNFSNVSFLEPLIKTMKTADPSSRPTAEQALQYWHEIRRGLSPLSSVCRLRGKDETWPVSAVFDTISTIRLCMRISRHAYARVMRLLTAMQ